VQVPYGPVVAIALLCVLLLLYIGSSLRAGCKRWVSKLSPGVTSAVR
jgi:hypothetical protein